MGQSLRMPQTANLPLTCTPWVGLNRFRWLHILPMCFLCVLHTDGFQWWARGRRIVEDGMRRQTETNQHTAGGGGVRGAIISWETSVFKKVAKFPPSKIRGLWQCSVVREAVKAVGFGRAAKFSPTKIFPGKISRTKSPPQLEK